MNGTRRAGFAALTGDFLKTQGVTVAEVGNAPNKDTAESLIVHTPGNALKAQLIGQLLGITNIAEDPQLVGGDVAIVLGNNADITWFDHNGFSFSCWRLTWSCHNFNWWP